MTGRAKRRLFVWTANAICVCVAVLLISALLLTSARWSGRFMLRINVKLPPAIERDSLMYMPCRDEQTAEWLCSHGNQVTEGFELPYQRTVDYDVVSVSIGGKSSILRICDTYYQPDSVVLQQQFPVKAVFLGSSRQIGGLASFDWRNARHRSLYDRILASSGIDPTHSLDFDGVVTYLQPGGLGFEPRRSPRIGASPQ